MCLEESFWVIWLDRYSTWHKALLPMLQKEAENRQGSDILIVQLGEKDQAEKKRLGFFHTTRKKTALVTAIFLRDVNLVVSLVRADTMEGSRRPRKG